MHNYKRTLPEVSSDSFLMISTREKSKFKLGIVHVTSAKEKLNGKKGTIYT